MLLKGYINLDTLGRYEVLLMQEYVRSVPTNLTT